MGPTLKASQILAQANDTGVQAAGGATVEECGLFASVLNTTNVAGALARCPDEIIDAFAPPILDVGIAGDVVVDDGANADDDEGFFVGFPASPDEFDWFSFDVPSFRTWGHTGAPGRWTGDDDGRIVDTRLLASDVHVLNKSGDLSNVNDTFAAGQPCPAQALRVGNGVYVNAIEVLGDRRGDDDGLCEESESCLYTPNVGAYQGEADTPIGPCTLPTPAPIGGVDLFGPATNGI